MIDKKEYKAKCEKETEALGFAFYAHGCPCNGSPLIYRKMVEGHKFELDVWPSRGYWRIYESRTMVACGTEPNNITTKIKPIWDILKP